MTPATIHNTKTPRRVHPAADRAELHLKKRIEEKNRATSPFRPISSFFRPLVVDVVQMTEVYMRYPLVICSNGKLIIAAADFFDGIGKLDMPSSVLEINVTREGRAGFEWVLDADGTFFDLRSEGILPLNFFQRLGLSRARERFRIALGRPVTVSEIRERISKLHDQFPEAPNVSDLQEQMASLAPEHVLAREDMLRYLGA